MICVKANLKGQFMVGFGYKFKLQKEVKSMQKQPSCIKRVQPSNSLDGKGCEIKGGGHKMAAMMLIILNFIKAQNHY